MIRGGGAFQHRGQSPPQIGLAWVRIRTPGVDCATLSLLLLLGPSLRFGVNLPGLQSIWSPVNLPAERVPSRRVSWMQLTSSRLLLLLYSKTTFFQPFICYGTSVIT